jgi:hypothetical protein
MGQTGERPSMPPSGATDSVLTAARLQAAMLTQSRQDGL